MDIAQYQKCSYLSQYITPLLNIEITLEGPPTHFQLIFKSLEQNQKDQIRRNRNSRVASSVNPPEGANHSLKCVELKIQHHIYFKKFSKLTTLFEIMGPGSTALLGYYRENFRKLRYSKGQSFRDKYSFMV